MQRNVDRDVTQRPSSDVAQFLCDVMNNTKVDYHYVREKVIEEVIDLMYTKTKDQTTFGLTKALLKDNNFNF